MITACASFNFYQANLGKYPELPNIKRYVGPSKLANHLNYSLLLVSMLDCMTTQEVLGGFCLLPLMKFLYEYDRTKWHYLI